MSQNIELSIHLAVVTESADTDPGTDHAALVVVVGRDVIETARSSKIDPGLSALDELVGFLARAAVQPGAARTDHMMSAAAVLLFQSGALDYESGRWILDIRIDEGTKLHYWINYAPMVCTRDYSLGLERPGAAETADALEGIAGIDIYEPTGTLNS